MTPINSLSSAFAKQVGLEHLDAQELESVQNLTPVASQRIQPSKPSAFAILTIHQHVNSDHPSG